MSPNPNCPRCGANNMTFSTRGQTFSHQTYRWKNYYEVFCVCRHCQKSTIFLVSLNEINAAETFSEPLALLEYDGSLNQAFDIERYISLRDNVTRQPPEHLPEEIANAFTEGATCFAVGCYNAAATMFRLCVDIATRPLLPDEGDTSSPQPNARQRRDLGLRLAWLFDNNLLPDTLRALARCIREDANDGAHVGNLTKEDAEDVLEFTILLLERLITEPRKLDLAEARRVARRSS